MKCYAAIVVTALAACIFGFGKGEAETGIVALDRPSLMVRAPTRVMLDAVTLAGARLVAVGEHGVIIYSDDNGRSWTQAKVPIDATLTTVGFADAKNGWAAGNSGVILHSSDGGMTWSLQLTGIQADQLTLASAEMAQQDNSKAPGAPLALRRAQHLFDIGPSVPFLAILPLSPNNAIVFGAYRMMMETHDGGKDWVDGSLSIGDPISHHLYGTVSTGKYIFVVGEAGLVFRSSDGGKSFPPIGAAGSATLFGIAAARDGSLLAYGVAGMLFRSSDSGVTWTQIPMPHSADITALATLSSGAIVLASEAGLLYVSRDDGLNFQALAVQIPMAPYAIIQASDGTFVIAGSRGILTMPVSSLVIH